MKTNYVICISNKDLEMSFTVGNKYRYVVTLYGKDVFCDIGGTFYFPDEDDFGVRSSFDKHFKSLSNYRNIIINDILS